MNDKPLTRDEPGTDAAATITLQRLDAFTDNDRAVLRALSPAVYPPDAAGDGPELASVEEIIGAFVARLRSSFTMSSSPSPFTSATAIAGPSVDSILGINRSRSKSTKSFSRCVKGSPSMFAAWAKSVPPAAIGAGAAPGAAAATRPTNLTVRRGAQQAVRIGAKGDRPHRLTVVPTRPVPQGVAALTAYDPSITESDALTAQMKAHMDDVQTGEVTQAVRSATVDGVQVHQGDIIGLHNGKLVSCGKGLSEVALDLLQKMEAGESALITLFYGDFVAVAAAQDFAETVRQELSLIHN